VSAVTGLPLAGIVVVSLEQAVAAPYATRQLADLGARVIKIERPAVGDFARGYDDTVHGESSYFVWLNRSKESLTLDLKAPEGQKILRELLADADVFVQNLGPGATGRMGLGAADLAETQPQADRVRHFRLRRGRTVADAEGLRPAGPGRGRAHVGHRLRGRGCQGRDLGRRRRRR
jgi:hypothetical protein